MRQSKSIGPFQALGKLFGMTGTLIDTADNVVSRTSHLVDVAFDAIEIPTNNMLEDLKCDSIVDNAHRDVRIMTAQAEAEEIRKALSTPKPARGRPAKSK